MLHSIQRHEPADRLDLSIYAIKKTPKHDKYFRVVKSRHANMRCQQRAIRMRVIRLIIAHADRRVHTYNGAVSLLITRKKLKALRDEHVAVPALLDRADGVALIVSSNGVIITAVHCGKWAHRKNSRRRWH